MVALKTFASPLCPIFSPRKKHCLKPARDRSDRATKVTVRRRSGSRQARGKQDHRCASRALPVEGLEYQNTVPATVCVRTYALEQQVIESISPYSNNRDFTPPITFGNKTEQIRTKRTKKKTSSCQSKQNAGANRQPPQPPQPRKRRGGGQISQHTRAQPINITRKLSTILYIYIYIYI